jgi:TolA-binding protein
MESQVSHTGDLYSVLGWASKNRNQLIGGAAVVLVATGVWWYAKCAREAKEVSAGEALSSALLTAPKESAPTETLLKLASDNAGTEAGGRALLAAATQQFVAGKIEDSLASFRRFLAEYDGSMFMSQAKLGEATCLQSQGKTADAIKAYKEVADRFPNANTALPAKLALGKLYEAEGKLEQARDCYLELTREQSLIGSEAVTRLNELIQKHPNLRPGAASAGLSATNSGVVKPAK